MSDSYDILEGEIKATTEKAVMIVTPDGAPVWVPRSCCEGGDDLDIGDDDPLVATWWLRKEGRD